MKTKTSLEQDILNITMKIHREFPELSKYIDEMPERNAGIDSDRLGSENFEVYYHSLQQLLKEYAKADEAKTEKRSADSTDLPAYPDNPTSEDIYKIGKRELNPSQKASVHKASMKDVEGQLNEKDFEEDMSGDDLDVPGSELDDRQEKTGSEDEENNYYSIGGDEHNSLDENMG